jgi:hypothetical protein
MEQKIETKKLLEKLKEVFGNKETVNIQQNIPENSNYLIEIIKELERLKLFNELFQRYFNEVERTRNLKVGKETILTDNIRFIFMNEVDTNFDYLQITFLTNIDNVLAEYKTTLRIGIYDFDTNPKNVTVYNTFITNIEKYLTKTFDKVLTEMENNNV